jgi:ADP-ribosylglycohydrolase
MPSQKERAISAVVAAFVADAATMGLHWIYDDNKMKELLENDRKPEFYEPPSCPFYSYENGNLSPYGDEILPLLKYLAASKEFEPKEFSSISYQAAKEYTGRLNQVMKELVNRGDTRGVDSLYPSTVDNRDAHGINKVPLLYARYGGNTHVFLQKLQEATLVHQNNPLALEGAKTFGLLLDAIIKDQKKIQQAIQDLSTNELISIEIRHAIQGVLERVAKEEPTKHDVLAAVNHFGKPCPLPGVLQGALYILLTNTGGIVEGVRSCIISGGESVSRSMMFASLYAAASTGTTSQLPEEWKTKTHVYEEVVSGARKITEKNTFLQ